MKRNKNFFLMWMALVGLFTVMPQVKAEDGNKLYVPKDIGVYWVKDGVEHPLTVSPSNFIASVTDYSAQIPFRADTFYVGVKWQEESQLASVATSATDSIPVTVKNGGETILATYKEDGGDGGFKGGKYDGHYDKVYVIKFENASDQIDGSLSFTIPDMGLSKYNLTVTRVAKSSISDLIKLYVVAGDTTSDETQRQEKWKYTFEKKNLFAPLEEEETDSIYFRSLNDSIDIVKSGEYVATDSVNAGQKLALVLRKKDMFSEVKVVQLGKVIEEKGYKFAGDCSVYPIEPGAFVTITVTAEDGTTKSEYKVKIFARPAKDFTDPQAKMVIGDFPRLDSLYLLDSKDGFYKLDKNFNPKEKEYKVTIPQEFAPNAVVGYVWDTVKGTGGTDTIFIGTLKYEFQEDDSAYYEVKMSSLDGSTLVETYKITVRYPEVSLKSFVLKDSVGTKNLDHSKLHFDFDSDTLIYPLTLEYNAQDSISVWLTVNDTHAKVELIGLSKTTPSGSKLSTSDQEKEGLYKFRIPVGKADEGFATSVFTVRDGSVEREYRLSLVKDWDLRLKKLVLKDGAGTFSEEVILEDNKYDGYRASFPPAVKLEDITVEAATPVDSSVSHTWSVIKDNDNYSVRVKTFDPGRTGDLTYTVKLESYSSDATLKLLSVMPGGELSPAFHPDTANYSVTVPGEQKYIFIVALPNHNDAEVVGNGEHDLDSDSTFTVTVTAKDKTTKTYFIKVTRDFGLGILPLSAQSVQVYGDGRALHVISPAAEKVGIYSVGGKLLYSLDKPAGKASVSGLPKGVLVIKGSSGWVKKAVI